MIVRSPWPSSLAGRTLLLLLVTALAVYLGGILAYRLIATNIAETARVAQVAGRLETAIDELTTLPARERGAAARALSSASFRAIWSATSLVDDRATEDPALFGLREQLATLIPGLAGRDVPLRWDEHAAGGSRNVLLGAVPLTDGSYVVFSAAMIPTAVPAVQAALLAVSLVFASVVAIAVLLLHGINAPLRRLADAANRYAHDQPMMLAERGPKEVVQAEQAFNAMQRRIHRLIEDRTQALAAVSHDLRTPIARLRLRCGLLAEKDVQADIERDLTEMEAMIESTLAYLRGEDDVETPRLTDLASLLTTLVDAASDAGHSATLSGSPHCVLMVRAVSVKRAFANLIDNAVTYGGRARVAMAEEPSGLRVTVDDDGPGIADADMDHVFEPFRRLDASRNRRTGGVGLGLTIARQAFARESGSLVLSNRPEGGLRAEVILPLRHGAR
ncbi:MAG: ATP-binding protein [Acetobacteraceae bacterium]